ncbi:MAG: NBR1-Ig-like domain-containing protein [Anaerolineales bacterium]|nr:MAG: NBR1-Ig-like domain-containing protein [Anaerolineales bacterium]
MDKKTRLFNLYLVFALILGACNLPANNPEDASATAAAQTVEALLSATPVVTDTLSPTPVTLTPIHLTETNTPVPTATATCNLAQFIADVTIPDGTVMTASQAFTKKWRLKNIGACAWNGFSLVFDSGDAMGGPASKPIATLNPGQEVDLEVALTAPATAGNYRGYWRIVTSGNVLVPIVNGYQGRAFYVDIKVQNPATIPPAVTQVILNPIESESGTVYEPAAGQNIPQTILAGDTSSNHLARGYMSFNIANLSGKTIQSASLALGSCSQVQDPFGGLAGIWVGEVQYSLPLKQADYSIAGTGIQLLNSIPGPIDVKALVQTRVTEGKNRFQIRLHPAGPSDADGQADYITCAANLVLLTIVYNP